MFIFFIINFSHPLSYPRDSSYPKCKVYFREMFSFPEKKKKKKDLKNIRD